ncbi:MAG: TlpA family protein disulfide reductase [Mesonia hippocampi]|uniref:TlpA family protein disulfide reductase n=1 Tax=Mesonia hippocampi TaxID=1628250 RepID=UPI003F9DAED4
MKKALLIIGGFLIVVIIIIMNIGFQIGDVRFGKQEDTLNIKQKYEIENSKFNTEYLESDKLVLINLWATWCKPCIEEMPILNEVKSEYSNKNIEFLSLSIDRDSLKLIDFLNSKKFQFEDITLENLEYRTAILNYLNDKPIDNKINSYTIPITYLIKDKNIIQTLKGGFESKDKLMAEINKILNCTTRNRVNSSAPK